MNFNNINKIFKLIESKADSIGYDIDNDRTYKEAISIVVDVETENRSIKKGRNDSPVSQNRRPAVETGYFRCSSD